MRDTLSPATCSLGIDSGLDSHELLKPHIVTPLPLQQSCSVGSDVHLLCLLTGYPPLEISWYINNELVTNSKDNRISFENNCRELVIKKLHLKDAGSITCYVKNKYGDVSSTCRLSVEESKTKVRSKSVVLPMKKKLTLIMKKSK